MLDTAKLNLIILHNSKEFEVIWRLSFQNFKEKIRLYLQLSLLESLQPQVKGCDGCGTQAFFDRDARPSTNFNYPERIE